MTPQTATALFNLTLFAIVVFLTVLFIREHFIIKRNQEQWNGIKSAIPCATEADERKLYSMFVESLDYHFMIGKCPPER